MPDSEPNKAEMTELHRAATIFATAAGVKVQHNAPYSVNLLLDDGRVLVIPLGSCSPQEEVAAVNGVVALGQMRRGASKFHDRARHLMEVADALRSAHEGRIGDSSSVLPAINFQLREIEYLRFATVNRPCECGHIRNDHLFGEDSCKKACSCRRFKMVEVDDAPL